MNRFRILVRAAALGILLAAAPSLHAQDTAAAPPRAEAGAPSASSGLPAGMGVPRTLRAYTHVYLAFTVAWVLLFGYTLSLGRRFRRLEDEVEHLTRGS
jgi:CcmD family protein